MENIYILSNTNDKQKDIQYLNIFNIKVIKSNINLTNYDVIIFTSKNAITSLDTFNKDYKKIPSYTIAQKTADILMQYNGNVTYIGKSSNGNDFAKEISKKLIGKKVLYVRAKNVVSKLVSILKNNNIECDELKVYETLCNKYDISYKPKLNAKIIFTSPSSIKCFLDNFNWCKSYKAVCIGKTTASYLPNNIKYKISKNISIDECIALARNI
jgi:uroporphyrinogen-III synthase